MKSTWEYLSASRLNSDCMASLNYKYNHGLIGPPNIYQILGDVGEKGIECILRNYKHSGYDPHNVEAECWQRLEERLRETGVERPPKQDVRRVIDAVLMFQPSPDYKLIAAQEWVELELPGILPTKIRGPLDFRGEEYDQIVIDDTKVSGKNISAPKREWILQGGVYCLATKQMLGLDYLPKFRIIYLYRGKTPSCRVMNVDLNIEALSDIFIAASNIWHCVETGCWPANRKSAYCSDRNCDYWYRCHEDHLTPWREINEKMSALSSAD